MKSGKTIDNKASITQPLLQDLKKREEIDSAIRNPSIGSEPLKPASLYQDSGSGFNVNFTFPQE